MNRAYVAADRMTGFLDDEQERAMSIEQRQLKGTGPLLNPDGSLSDIASHCWTATWKKPGFTGCDSCSRCALNAGIITASPQLPIFTLLL